MDEEMGFSMSSLRSAIRKAARLGRRPKSRRASGVTVGDPTENKSKQLVQPGMIGIGRRFRGARMVPVGMPAFTFTAGGSTLLQQSIQPQQAIDVKKLVINVTRSGASATSQIVTLAQVICGSDNQLPIVPGAASGVDVSLYARDVNDNEVSWAPVLVGNLLTIQIALNGVALAGTDTITVTVSMNALVVS